MTNEEAIKILQMYKDEIGQRVDAANAPELKEVYRWQMDGLNTAIKALEADAVEAIRCKNGTKDGDLISRQDAVNEIHKYFVEEIDKTPTGIDEDGDELYADMPTVNSLLACNKELSRRIKSLPSVPDSRQRGKWEPLTDFIGNEYFECSKCHDAFYVEFGTPEDNNYNFCPNCGAKMYKGGDDE